MMNVVLLWYQKKNKDNITRMRNILILLFACLSLSSCTNRFSIEGVSSVSLHDGKKFYLKVPKAEGFVVLDSTEMVHGEFDLKCKVDSVVLGSLFMENDLILPIAIESGKINVNIDNSKISLKGTPLNNKINEFMLEKNALEDRAYEVERLESRLIMDGKPQAEVEAEMEKQRSALSDDVAKLAKTYIQENYSNVLGPGIFLIFCEGLEFPYITPLMEEIISDAPESFKNDFFIKDFVNTARRNMQKIQEASREY